jgi:mRNA interferase RelE/StbE
VKAQFRSSFTKDLRGITDKGLLKRIRAAIEEVEQAESLRTVANMKRLKSGDN